MAEEKKVTETESTEPKVVYSYVVKRFDNKLYDFEGLPLEEGGAPSIDQYHTALDIVELGRKLDHQMIVEEAESRVFARLNAMAEQQAAAQAQADDPTKA